MLGAFLVNHFGQLESCRNTRSTDLWSLFNHVSMWSNISFTVLVESKEFWLLWENARPFSLFHYAKGEMQISIPWVMTPMLIKYFPEDPAYSVALLPLGDEFEGDWRRRIYMAMSLVL